VFIQYIQWFISLLYPLFIWVFPCKNDQAVLLLPVICFQIRTSSPSLFLVITMSVVVNKKNLDQMFVEIVMAYFHINLNYLKEEARSFVFK